MVAGCQRTVGTHGMRATHLCRCILAGNSLRDKTVSKREDSSDVKWRGTHIRAKPEIRHSSLNVLLMRVVKMSVYDLLGKGERAIESARNESSQLR